MQWGRLVVVGLSDFDNITVNELVQLGREVCDYLVPYGSKNNI